MGLEVKEKEKMFGIFLRFSSISHSGAIVDAAVSLEKGS